jgi:hypothetical protein
MSYLYGLDPDEQNNALDNANAHGADLSEIKPGFLEGSGEGTLTGLFSGLVAKPALLLGDTATPMLTPLAEQFDKAFGTGTKQWLEREQQKNVTMLQQLKDRQSTYGTAGQLVSGLTDVGSEAAVGFLAGGPAGSAAAAGTLQGYADYRLSKEEGIDDATAMGKGLITGVTNAAGVFVPAMKVGASLLANLGIGAGVNVAMGMGSRGATAELLEHNGYTEQAQQYQWLDKEAIVTDAILGAAFGGLGHFAHGKIALDGDRIDAALTTNEKLHTEIDTAPGIPKTPEARDAHVEAQIRATEQLLRGEPVDVADIAHRVDAVPDPALAQLHAVKEDILWDEMLKDLVDPKGKLEGDARFEKWLSQLEDEPTAASPVREPRPVIPKDGAAQDAATAKPDMLVKPHDGTVESIARAGDARPIEVERAQQILDTKPDLVAMNDNGEPVRAADLLQSANDDIVAAKRDSVLHDVAVACFLRG